MKLKHYVKESELQLQSKTLCFATGLWICVEARSEWRSAFTLGRVQVELDDLGLLPNEPLHVCT